MEMLVFVLGIVNPHSVSSTQGTLPVAEPNLGSWGISISRRKWNSSMMQDMVSPGEPGEERPQVEVATEVGGRCSSRG